MFTRQRLFKYMPDLSKAKRSFKPTGGFSNKQKSSF